MFKQHPDNIGYFKEKEFKHEFTYRLTKDEWALRLGFIHEIDVGDSVRFAIVKKTCAVVMTDETEEGAPVTEHWKIKRFEYDLK